MEGDRHLRPLKLGVLGIIEGESIVVDQLDRSLRKLLQGVRQVRVRLRQVEARDFSRMP